MSNQNSLYNKYSRYVGGGTSETADNRIEWWERTVLKSDVSDVQYAVENIYEGRLDLIASVFYNEPRYWWIVAQLNNIIDPISEVVPGRVLRMPTKERLQLLLSTKKGGKDSQRLPISTISPIIS
jgi:hypothetical protein